MKKLFFLIVFVFLSHISFSQTVTYTDYDENGVIEYVKTNSDNIVIEEGYYYKGKPYGIWRSYWNDGELRCVAQFKDGKRTGVWKFYNNDGKLKQKVTYAENRVTYAVQHRYFE